MEDLSVGRRHVNHFDHQTDTPEAGIRPDGDPTFNNGFQPSEVSISAGAQVDAPHIRVLVVDDHEILAQGLSRLLDSCADIDVVGIVGTVNDAVATAAQIRPDVILMDYQLPDGDGVAAVARIKQEVPSVQVVMLTGSGDDERLARRAFEVGCCGFLGKSRSVEDLLAVVRAAYAGEVLIAPSMLMRLLPRITRHYEGVGGGLSQRELEVLGVMAEGGTDKDIANRLFVSLNTARKHTQNIIRKLGAHSKLEAVVIAVREGVIHPL